MIRRPPRSTLFPYTPLSRSLVRREQAPVFPHRAADETERPLRRGEPLPAAKRALRSEEHTSELQSPDHLVCRLLLEKKKKTKISSNAKHTSWLLVRETMNMG